MGFFEILGIAIFLYYLVQLILWCILDSNIELAIKERFGQPISSLRGKVVWITGASSGIGKALAFSLAKYGVKLVLSSRRENELELVKSQALEQSNGLLAKDDILVLPMDMLELKQHLNCFDQVVNHFGKLDILVNNAGRSQRAAWDTIEIEVDRELFELDVFSVINLSRIAVRYFKSIGGKGHIAITSSGAGLITVPFSASYSAAKYALHGYFESLRAEEPSINVTIFCPGPVATNFLQECFTNQSNEKYRKPVSESDRRMSAQRCGDLFAIALANKVMLSWVGIFPIAILMYISQFFPNIKILIFKVLGARRMKKIREGR